MVLYNQSEEAYKKLPRSQEEAKDADFIVQPKVQSWRFPVKAMFMGVVGRPDKYRNVDGRIHLERVSKCVEVKKLTSHQNFSDNIIINSEIKRGE